VEGEVVDMGSLLNFGFRDPDGASREVVWVKPGVPVEHGIRRTEWTTVDLKEGAVAATPTAFATRDGEQ
jgi:hypothetical protein